MKKKPKNILCELKLAGPSYFNLVSLVNERKNGDEGILNQPRSKKHVKWLFTYVGNRKLLGDGNIIDQVQSKKGAC